MALFDSLWFKKSKNTFSLSPGNKLNMNLKVVQINSVCYFFLDTLCSLWATCKCKMYDTTEKFTKVFENILVSRGRMDFLKSKKIHIVSVIFI